VGVNYKFLKQIVKDIDANEIKIEASQPTRAMIAHNSTEEYDLTSLIMPVMLN
jgi:DNA polymerase III sliding clamp (beta) subunit (PCNA family)